MQKVLFALLTSKQARDVKLIEARLDQEFHVGNPWLAATVPGLLS